jgi:riboflavin synthase
MFTGIISDVRQIIDITPSDELNRLRIASAYEAGTIPLGASVANSGACLTVVGVEPRGAGSAIAFDVGAETLQVTTLRQWPAGPNQLRAGASSRRRTRRPYGERPC